MERSRKAGIGVIVLLGIAIFGYSQYISAEGIQVDVVRKELFSQDEQGTTYNIELEFTNPSLLVLTAGETEFFVEYDDQMVGKGIMDPFTLTPLSSSFVNGIFKIDDDTDEDAQRVRISGTTKYDILIATIEVPFSYYPTAEQARKFIDDS